MWPHILLCLHSVLRSNPVTNPSRGLLRDYEPLDLFQALKSRDRVTPRSVFSLISWGCARPRRGPSSRGLPVLVNTIPGRQIVSASIMYKCSAISRYQPIPAIDIKLVGRITSSPPSSHPPGIMKPWTRSGYQPAPGSAQHGREVSPASSKPIRRQ